MARTAPDIPSHTRSGESRPLDTEAVETERVDALSPLRFPVFRAIWIASAISNLGALIQSVGAAWMMTSIATSAYMVTLVQASVTLPIMMLSLVAGAVADSVDRRKVMLVAQIFMFIVSVTLAVCAWRGLITPWLLLMFTFLIGCGTAFNAPAWQASVGDMVPRTQLAGAVALNSMAFNVARSFGPALGGAIVAAAGAAATFTINAVSYIALITVLLRWRPSVPTQVLPRESLGIAITSGVRYVSMSPAIRIVLARSAIFGVGASAVSSLLPLVAKHLVGGGPLTYGVLLGAFGIGAVVGGMSLAKLKNTVSTEGIVRWSSAISALAIAAVALSESLPLTMVALLFAGAAWVIALSIFSVAVQLSAPRWVVARALSLYQMCCFGGMAAGSYLWGVLADSRGVSFALFMAALVLLVSAIAGLWHRLAQTEDLNLTPVRTWQAPETAVPIESRTGPVVITVEYRILETDVVEFLAAMNERRRIRRRDGARNWMLLRDLSDPEVWIERFNTPTWLDYIRHNSRLTHEDAAVPQRLVALHQGPGAPHVRRMIERQTNVLPAATESSADHLAEPLTDPSRSS
jgi:predicted MFS family arabinose efflux permease